MLVGITVQKIEDAESDDVNLDFYPVQIDTFPTVDGYQLTGPEFVSYVRTHFNDFIDTFYSVFYPFKPDPDGPKWNSNNPLGAVIGIDLLGPDNAAVVCGEADDIHWRFVTVRTSLEDTGSHPVSGTREFGLRNGNIFYTRGADRTTGFPESLPLGPDIAFGVGKKLWSSLQLKTTEFVNNHGGKATALQPTQKEVPWDEAKVCGN